MGSKIIKKRTIYSSCKNFCFSYERGTPYHWLCKLDKDNGIIIECKLIYTYNSDIEKVEFTKDLKLVIYTLYALYVYTNLPNLSNIIESSPFETRGDEGVDGFTIYNNDIIVRKNSSSFMIYNGNDYGNDTFVKTINVKYPNIHIGRIHGICIDHETDQLIMLGVDCYFTLDVNKIIDPKYNTQSNDMKIYHIKN